MSFFSMPPLPTFSDIGVLAGTSSGKITISVKDGSFTSKFSGTGLVFHYNPTSFSMDRNSTWDDKKTPKQTTGVLNFTGGASDTVNFTVLLDATEEDGDDAATLLNKVKELYNYTVASIEDGSGDTAVHKRPPLLKLKWSEVVFTGVMSALKVDFVMFDSSGNPVRANVTVTMLGRAFRDDSVDDFFNFYSASNATI